jgi:hypothetical protein
MIQQGDLMQLFSQRDRTRNAPLIASTGHIDKDGSIDTTFVSYMVYNVTDIEAVKRQLRK